MYRIYILRFTIFLDMVKDAVVHALRVMREMCRGEDARVKCSRDAALYDVVKL
jgi:hypothetical protein